jgi:hypothetical protein
MTAAEPTTIRPDAPFKFTGKINKLTFKLEPEQSARP